MSYATYLFFRFAIGLFGLIPMRGIYIVSDGLFYLNKYLLKYRYKVVETNLAKSFPEKTLEQRTKIRDDFYRHFCDLVVESIKGLTMSSEALLKRSPVNPDAINKINAEGRSCIGALGHFGNWEWAGFIAGLLSNAKGFVIFQPLKNKYINDFLRRKEDKTRTYFIPSKESLEIFTNEHQNSCVFYMLGDQSPSSLKHAVITKFLNQPTACLHGIEKYAKMFNLPVLFIQIKRIKRGYYQFTSEMLVENPNQTADGEIIKAYMRRLEETIVETPHQWLWTHKRWKMKLENRG